jgi:hypothetical protein
MLLCSALVGVARSEPPVQVWIAPGDAPIANATRSALARALATHGRVMHEVQTTTVAEPSLALDLERARRLHAELKLDEALAALRSLSDAAEHLGGADLDTAALADLYLTLGLCELELGQPESAWDAFVRSVRIDPTRTLDPARIPPRATASHRRAQLELGQLPPVTLQLRVPAAARVRIDGDDGHVAGVVARRLVPGPHFVRVDAPGFRSFRGVVTWTSPNEIFAPDLRPLEAPIEDAPDSVSARVERVPEGWRMALRGHSAGMSLEAGAFVRAEDADAIAAQLTDRVLGPAVARKKPAWKRWWPWTIAGVAAAAIVIAVPIAVTAHRGPAAGSVGGPLEPVR